MAQFSECLGFDLSDAFAGDVELLADFFQRVIGVHADTEAHTQHLGFPRGQGFQNVFGRPGQTGAGSRIHGRLHVLVFHEIAEV